VGIYVISFEKRCIRPVRYFFPKKNLDIKGVYMVRFSVSFTDEEYDSLQKMMNWYKENLGLKMSRCALIKHLLFQEFRDVQDKTAI
jgi:hypothetical protein